MKYTSNSAIIISDTHGCGAYVKQAREVAEEFGSEIVFHCGDFGSMNDAIHFFNAFRDYEVYFVKGNHDRKKNLKKISEHYPNVSFIDDEVVEITTEHGGLKVIGMGLPWHEFTFSNYSKKLINLLEENPDAFLLSHYGNGEIGIDERRSWYKSLIGKWHRNLVNAYGVVNIHGHNHAHYWDMYSRRVPKNVEFDEEPMLIDFEEKKIFNVALRIGILPLQPLKDYSGEFYLEEEYVKVIC